MKFSFPYDSVRPSQQELINDVKLAVENGKHLVADAPTGLGKTVASILPALEYAVENGKTVFFLTSKLTQHRAAIETLKKIRGDNQFGAVDIVGKMHLCSQDVNDMDSGMFYNYCKAMVKDKRCVFYKNTNLAETELDRSGLSKAMLMKIPTTKEAMRLVSARYCTYEMLMDAAKKADAVVCDYFHMFGMGKVFLKRMGKNLSDSIIIVDEAHNLPTRLRSYLSSKLSTWLCDAAAQEAKDFTEFEIQETAKEIGKCLTELAKKHILTKQEAFTGKMEFFDKVTSLGNYDKIIEKMTIIGQRVLEERKISYVDRMAEFLNIWKRDDVGYARILSRERRHGKDHVVLQFNCLDPSIISRPIIDESHSTILMSGTLRPMEMYRDLLGLRNDRSLMKSYTSPFPKENRKNIVVRGITTRYKERTNENIARLAIIVSLCVHSIKGNCAVFFPSYEMRDKICELVKVKKHIILEKSGMTKEEKDGVNDELSEYATSGAVLFGVVGASFSEGVDLPGDLLNGVVVVGLPLEKPDLSVEALIKYYDIRFNRGRDYGYNFPAMIRVMQAAGRCIRTEHDRGVVVFVDERFTNKPYCDIFSKDMKIIITDRPELEIAKFFKPPDRAS